MNHRQYALFVFGFLISSESVHCAHLNTWWEHIGKGDSALTPYVYAGSSFGIHPSVFGESASPTASCSPASSSARLHRGRPSTLSR